MRLEIVLLLFVVCCLAITDAHRTKSKKTRPIVAGNQWKRLIKKGVMRDATGFRGRRPMLPRHRGRSGRNRQLRPNRLQKLTWKLNKCANVCQDECGNTSVCLQTCTTKCTGKRSESLCMKECVINDCTNRNCTVCCRRSTLLIKQECRRENCATQCQPGQRKRRRNQMCRRCTRENCFQDESLEHTEEEEVGVSTQNENGREVVEIPERTTTPSDLE